MQGDETPRDRTRSDEELHEEAMRCHTMSDKTPCDEAMRVTRYRPAASSRPTDSRARTEDVLQAGFVLQWIAVEGTALQPEQHDK